MPEKRYFYSALPHCLGALGGGTRAMHCLNVHGHLVVHLLQCIAILHGYNGQRNSCNALSHCPGAVGTGSPAMCYHTTRGAVGSAIPAMSRLTASG